MFSEYSTKVQKPNVNSVDSIRRSLKVYLLVLARFLEPFLIFHFSDHTCHQLQNTSRSINVHGGIEKMDPNVSIPDTWAENSNHNIQESQGEIIFDRPLQLDLFCLTFFLLTFSYKTLDESALSSLGDWKPFQWHQLQACI